MSRPYYIKFWLISPLWPDRKVYVNLQKHFRKNQIRLGKLQTGPIASPMLSRDLVQGFEQ